MSRDPQWRSAVGWVLASEALFAAMRLSTRANAAALPWPALAACRFLGGALVIAAVASARGASLRVRHRRGAWARSLFGVGSSMGTFYALGSRGIAVGDVTTLSATAPLFVAMLSGPLLRERVTVWVLAGLAIGFAGVVVLVGPSFGTTGRVAAAALGGAASFAMAIVWLRRIGPTESGEAVALHMSLVAGSANALVGVALLASGGAVRPTAAAISWPALALAATAGGLAQIAVTRAYALGRAAALSGVSYAGVAMTYLLEAALTGRVPRGHQLAGAVLIASAGLLAARRPAEVAEMPVADAEA